MLHAAANYLSKVLPYYGPVTTPHKHYQHCTR
jgi:hypothetical protein